MEYKQGEILSRVNFPSDIKQLTSDELLQLCDDLRSYIIDVVSKNGGHLGASLGVVELTVALHYIFDTPNDVLVWDVGHQAYGHKILTGRKDQFPTNRKLGGISGFPKRKESEYDAFGVGHSSTSISAVLGMAIANHVQGKNERCHIAVIGDASMQAGMAFEAMNHAGVEDVNLIVILNDNCMSIDPSVGALNEYLVKTANSYEETQVKEKFQKEENFFTSLNFQYSGPTDGHNLLNLIQQLEQLKNTKGPRLLHCLTTKGKGYVPAETGNATKWHAPGLFDAATGKILKNDLPVVGEKYQHVFGKTLVELAKMNDQIVGITPAMPTGSSLKYLMEEVPERAFDVGIAEQHAVTFSAGLAANGLLPYCAIYSTFLQRGYDQLVHDVAIQDLKVVFCIDRGGLVGNDGATHHGTYDLAYLRCIPNMTIFSPLNEVELRNILYSVQKEEYKGAIAIRYPRGRGRMNDWQQDFEYIPLGKGVELQKGNKIAVLTIGNIGNEATVAINQLLEEGIEIGHYDIRFLKPLDQSLLKDVFDTYDSIITVENGCVKGGLGSAILEWAADNDYRKKIITLGVPDEVIEHGSQKELYKLCGIDSSSIYATLKHELEAAQQF